jgi:prepilin-type N-terminal cleavage/methylation domain-containing protein
MNAKKFRKESGFTMIELMVALLVLSTVFVGYISANIIAQRNTETLNERTVAIQDANRVIEQMRTIATSPGDFPDNVTDAYPNNTTPVQLNNLTNEVATVSYADPNSNPLITTITVTWLSYTGRPSTLSIQTYITQR